MKYNPELLDSAVGPENGSKTQRFVPVSQDLMAQDEAQEQDVEDEIQV